MDSARLLLAPAIELFNRGDYFAAAEALERSAATAPAELKDLVGALNRIAAAMHLRFERGGRKGALMLLSQAALTLEDFRPARAGIDVDRLCVELSAFTGDLRAGSREKAGGLKRRVRRFIERRRAPKINPAP
jgi:predicted metal-dependent hydrolase